MKKSSKSRNINSYLLGVIILSLLLNCLLLWLFIKPIFSIVTPDEPKVKVCQSDVDFYSTSESTQVLDSISSENYSALLWYDVSNSHTLRITTYNSYYEIVCYNTGITRDLEDYFKNALLTNNVELINGNISFNGQEFSSDITESEWNSSIKDILVAWANK